MDSAFAENPPRKGRRQMDTGESIPWQVRAVAYMGVPSAIACYLVYVLAQSISPAITAQSVSLSEQQKTLNSLVLSVASVQQQLGQNQSGLDKMLRVLQVSCVNQAKDSDARDRCLR